MYHTRQLMDMSSSESAHQRTCEFELRLALDSVYNGDAGLVSQRAPGACKTREDKCGDCCAAHARDHLYLRGAALRSELGVVLGLLRSSKRNSQTARRRAAYRSSCSCFSVGVDRPGWRSVDELQSFAPSARGFRALLQRFDAVPWYQVVHRTERPDVKRRSPVLPAAGAGTRCLSF